MDKKVSSTRSFLRELRRRKVIRTCVLYSLVCWGGLQVGEFVYPAIGLDEDRASALFLYLALAGLPLTFFIAWFYQITPAGVVRTNPFVERRVLNNIPPINDRRREGVSNLVRHEDTQDFSWSVAAESGPLVNLSFAVTRPLVLGRALECDLAIVSPHVSRQHARLDLDGEQLVLEDLGSSNGTLVNGVRLKGRAVLQHDDEVRFHDIAFRVKENFSSPRREIASMNKTTFIENTAHIKPLGDKQD
jgi:hypothetical protein